MAICSTGSMVLFNLELDLQPLLEQLPFKVKRAFAGKLTVAVRLASRTIQARARPFMLSWQPYTHYRKHHTCPLPTRVISPILKGVDDGESLRCASFMIKRVLGLARVLGLVGNASSGGVGTKNGLA